MEVSSELQTIREILRILQELITTRLIVMICEEENGEARCLTAISETPWEKVNFNLW